MSRSTVLRFAPITVATLIAASLAACGGGGGGGSTSASPSPVVQSPAPAPAATTIKGVAATGAALANAVVTVSDADATTPDVTTRTDARGNFSADVSSLKAPFFISVSGKINGEDLMISAVVPEVASNVENITNVTPLTHAVAALLAPARTPSELSNVTILASAAKATAVANATKLIVDTLKSDPKIAAALGENFHPLTTAFVANQTGIDAVLDQLDISLSTLGVTISNNHAPVAAAGAATGVFIAATDVSLPSATAAKMPQTSGTALPSAVQLKALAQRLQDCLALPASTRNIRNVPGAIVDLAPACKFVPADWKSNGGDIVKRADAGHIFGKADEFKGATAGQPTIAVVLAPPNRTAANEFKHPYCNTRTCVVMRIPMTTASGKPYLSDWVLGEVNGSWDYVGNQLPYSMGADHRNYRKVNVNTSPSATTTTAAYFLASRFESMLRLTFNPVDSSASTTKDVRAVRWTGPGLPAAGVVTVRSNTCGTSQRFVITNQQGSLLKNNGTADQLWSPGSAADFILDSAGLNGIAQSMPVPTGTWGTGASVTNQAFAPTNQTTAIPAWSTYKAEVFYFANTSKVADEVIYVHNDTPFEPASTGANIGWPTLNQSVIDAYLKPTGANAGALTSLNQTITWTNPVGAYVNYGGLFSTNLLTVPMPGSASTAQYNKRGYQEFWSDTYGTQTAANLRWNDRRSSGMLSPSTATFELNDNPRCSSDEVLPLDANYANFSYRDIYLYFRGPNKKLYTAVTAWQH